MSESKKVRAFGVLGALVAASVLAMGCSAAPDQQGGSAPEVKDPGVAPEMAIGTQYIQVVPSAPLPAYCFYYSPPTYQVFPAHYVEKVPNHWGYEYASWNGRNYQDGYSIPFPTPWATPPATPDPTAYERSLWNIPSTLFWQYLVHDITPPPSGGRIYSEDITHAYFMVGIPSLSDYTAASNLAAQNTGYPVEARVNTCVRVVTRSGNIITDTGEQFFVYDEHDPRAPPGDSCGPYPC